MVSALTCACGPECARSGDATPSADSDDEGQPQLVVDVTEELLNRFVATTDTRTEPVRDFVLGADVFGWQRTTTRATLDVRPAEGWFATELVLRGTTFSDTIGITPLARAWTLGRHEFEARKEIVFPGDFLYTRRPRVSVRPSLHNQGIYPVGGGIPVLGPVIIGIAFQRAEDQRALAESIAAGKIANPLRENFNREVDAQLTTINQTLQSDPAAALLTSEFKPDFDRLFSSETAVSYRGRFASARDVPTPPENVTADASRFAIHDSFLDEIVTRLELGGQQFVPDDAFIALEAILRRIEARAVPPLPPELEFVRPTGPFGQVPVELYGETPVAVRFVDNEVEITLQVKLQLVPGSWSPPLLLKFAYVIELFDEYLRATPEARQVKPVDVELRTELLLLQPIIRRQMREMLPAVHLPRTLKLETGRSTASGETRKSVRLRVERLIADSGWLVLSVN